MSKGPQRLVLVVDPDPGAAAALGPALRREGYQIRIARDGARALQLAVLRVPDLMLIDEATPVVAPRTLVRILRSNPRTAGVPILFAGVDPERLPDGANALVRKPLDTDDLLSGIRRLVDEAGVDTTSDSERFEGSLSQLPLADVLQMLGNNRRTGQLLVAGDALRAEIRFERGEIVDAASGAVGGEKALSRVLALREGRFVFQPGEGGSERHIERSLTELLLEGLALSDEMAVIARQLPPRDALLERAAREVGAPDILEVVGPTEDEVRALLATPQRVGDVLDRSSATDLLTARAILGLLSSGEVQLLEPRPVVAAPLAPVVSEADAQALRARLRRGYGASTVGKLLIAGGDATARHGMIERLPALAGFRASPEHGQPFGTLGALHVADLRLDLVLLPDEPVLSPLWGPLAAGALGVLVLGPIQPEDSSLSSLVRTARLAVGWCGPTLPQDPIRGGEGAVYLGPDPCEALRTLVARAASRARPS